MVPSAADIKKRKATLDGFLKQIDPVTGQSIEKKMVQMVRSSIRQAWMKSPTKLAYLYMHTIPDMDPTTRTKWLVQCECCKQKFKVNEVEVDHITGCHSFLKVEDFEQYFNNILMVDFSGLQILCKDRCHATKTLSEKLGISFEEALIEKEVIAICKGDEKSWLKKKGITPASNAKLRRQQVTEVLKNVK